MDYICGTKQGCHSVPSLDFGTCEIFKLQLCKYSQNEGDFLKTLFLQGLERGDCMESFKPTSREACIGRHAEGLGEYWIQQIYDPSIRIFPLPLSTFQHAGFRS